MDLVKELEQAWDALKHQPEMDEVTAEELKTSALTNLTLALNTSRIALAQVVEALGHLLVSAEPFERAKGVAMLSAIVSDLDSSLLSAKSSSQQTTSGMFLLSFFLDRLHDQPSVGDVLKGVLKLLEKDVVPMAEMKRIPMTIFKELNVQSFQQSVRFVVFEIFRQLLSKALEEMKSIGDDFLFGYIQAMDGEKDPRNLLLAFRLMTTIIQNFKLDATSKYLDDLFEVLFCYFPITFRAPANDPYGISSDDLKHALKVALGSCMHFNSLILPLLIEKLSSSSVAAKKDSMDLLIFGIPTYGPESIATHMDTLWEILKLEIYEPKEEFLGTLALETLQAILQSLSKCTNPKPLSSLLNKKLLPAIHASIAPDENTNDSEGFPPSSSSANSNVTKNAKTTAVLLKYLASASDPCCYFVIDKIVQTDIFPLLLKRANGQILQTRRKLLLDCLLNIVQGCNELYGVVEVKSNEEDDDNEDEDVQMGQQQDQTTSSEEHPLFAVKDKLMDLFIEALHSNNEYPLLRIVGCKGIFHLCLAKGLLADMEVSLCIQNFAQLILNNANVPLTQSAISQDSYEIRMEAINSLNKLTSYFDASVLKYCLFDVYRELESQPSESLLKTLLILSDNSSSEIFRTNLYKLHHLFQKRAAQQQTTVLLPILETIYNIFESKWNTLQSSNNTKSIQEFQSIGKDIGLVSFVNYFIASQQPTPRNTLELDIFIARLVAILFRSLDEQEQTHFVQTIVLPKLFVDGSQITQLGNRMSLLLTAFVGNLRNPRVLVERVPDFVDQVLSSLVTMNIDGDESETCSKWILDCAGSVMNKMGFDAVVKDKTVIGQLESMFLKTVTSEDEMKHWCRVAQIWIVLTKALVLRGDNVGYKMTDTVLSCLQSPSTNSFDTTKWIAKRLGDIIAVSDKDITMNKTSFANIKVLFKQRFFGHVLPKLLSSTSSTAQFIAICSLIQQLPKTIINQHIQPLFPILIQSLQSLSDSTQQDSSTLYESVLDVIANMLSTPDQIPLLEQHITTLINLFLSVSDCPTTSNATLIPVTNHSNTYSMNARIKALTLLAKLGQSVAYDLVHPVKKNVLMALEVALDDRKRLVRKEAVRTRNVWFLLGGKDK